MVDEEGKDGEVLQKCSHYREVLIIEKFANPSPVTEKKQN